MTSNIYPLASFAFACSQLNGSGRYAFALSRRDDMPRLLRFQCKHSGFESHDAGASSVGCVVMDHFLDG